MPGPKPQHGICQGANIGAEITEEEREFLVAIDKYKRTQRRPFPTWREALQVLRSLGWRKGAPAAANHEEAG